jgi:hypothetical protein
MLWLDIYEADNAVNYFLSKPRLRFAKSLFFNLFALSELSVLKISSHFSTVLDTFTSLHDEAFYAAPAATNLTNFFAS